MITIGNRNIQVQAQKYKGKYFVHIRQWYEKDGEMRPGKGIAMTMEEWKEFTEKFEDIKQMIKEEIG